MAKKKTTTKKATKSSARAKKTSARAKKASTRAPKAKEKDMEPAAKAKRANAHLSDEFLEKMRVELERRMSALRRNISTELDDMRDASAEGHHLADMEDLSGDASDDELSYKVLEIEGDELVQIDYALKAIDDGTYGICEDLGTPISMERLKALPFVTLSIDAQRAREREQMGH